MYLLQRLTHLLLVFSALWVAIVLVVKKKENFVTNQELFSLMFDTAVLFIEKLDTNHLQGL